MPRPRQNPPRVPLTKAEIPAPCYVGSGEHKIKRWFGNNLPGAFVGEDGTARRPGRQMTTICERTSNAQRIEASTWVRQALAAGQLRYYDGDGPYPKHIWYLDVGGQYWFGFAVNQVLGTYKGWPIDEKEKREKFDRVV